MSSIEQQTAEETSEATAPGDASEVTLSPEEQARKKRTTKVIALLVLLVLAVGAGLWYLHSQTYEDTDDAQVDGHIAPVSARISGTVTSVYVQDNQHVDTNTPILDLDTRTQVANLGQLRAQFQQAEAQLAAQQPNIAITRNNNSADVAADDAQLAQADALIAAAQSDRAQFTAKLAEAQSQAQRDRAQAERYKTLLDKREASREEYERYAAASQASDANVTAAQAAIVSATQVIAQRRAQQVAERAKRNQDAQNAPEQLAVRRADIATQRANTASAQAAIEKANLDLTFSRVVAPVSGIVTQRSAEVGTHVAEGAQVMMIVQTDDLWVTANFKETQLRRMVKGQGAKLHVDALDRDFDGYVDSLSAITGSRSSVLPPENATGNYVKVIQRLPVRLRFRAGQAGLDLLRPGMSVEPRVFVK